MRRILLLVALAWLVGCPPSKVQQCADACKNNGGMANHSTIQGGCHEVCTCMDAVKKGSNPKVSSSLRNSHSEIKAVAKDLQNMWGTTSVKGVINAE
jgi:hypothetical protein